MKHRHYSGICLVAVALVFGLGGLTGCTDGSGQKVGSAVGTVIGGIVGSRIGRGSGKVAATVMGSFVGEYFGRKIAEALTESDRTQMATATEDALNSPDEIAEARWLNDETGNGGSVSAGEAYKETTDGRDEVCREFVQTVTLADGTKGEAKGFACQQADGSWTFRN